MNICSGSSRVAVMGFFADWCPHCKDYKPEFDKAKQANKNPDIIYHRFDGDTQEGKDAMQQYEVRGFPTVKLYLCNTNEVVPYQGPRNATALAAFVRKHI